MKSLLSFAGVVTILLASLSSTEAQLASLAGDYKPGVYDAPMVPLMDSNGTGTWSYYNASANSLTNPTGATVVSLLNYGNNQVGGTHPLYLQQDDPNGVPAVSDGQIFIDSPAPAADYLQVHPSVGAESTLLRWTAGAGETGNLTLSLDFSRVGVGSTGRNPVTQGFDNVFVLENGTELYSADAVNIGSDTGLQNIALNGVTLGTTVDVVIETYNNDFGFNAGYVKADISAVPEPSTWLMMTGGLVMLGVWFRRRIA